MWAVSEQGERGCQERNPPSVAGLDYVEIIACPIARDHATRMQTRKDIRANLAPKERARQRLHRLNAVCSVLL